MGINAELGERFRIANATFNARSESVAEKPMFRAACKPRRCLVTASGFDEWRKISAKVKQPCYLTLTSGEPMPMAGPWEAWHGADGSTVESCTICTHTASDMMRPLHDRMPVIPTHPLIEPWLNPALIKPYEIQPLSGHYPTDQVQCHEVGKDVGNVRNQGQHLIKPLHESYVAREHQQGESDGRRLQTVATKNWRCDAGDGVLDHGKLDEE
jgi:putative SOS response-associated peptidase YedK